MTVTTNPADHSLTFRARTAADDAALTRLAQLDSAPPFGPGSALLAEVDGELVAAVSLDRGERIANPFRRTDGIVTLLEARAEALETAPRRTPGPTSVLRSLRMSFAERA